PVRGSCHPRVGVPARPEADAIAALGRPELRFENESMRAKLLLIVRAPAALALAATPVAPAVTIAPKLLAGLTSHPAATTAVVEQKDKLRSCQVGDAHRAHTRSAGRARPTPRRPATR